jgi:outer membrane protein
MRTLPTIALAGTLALAAQGAVAYEAGDFILRVGAATVEPDDNSDGIVLPGATLPNGIAVDTDTQVGLIGAWMFSDNVGLELLAATPFQHDFSITDLNGLPGGSVKHLPPTLSVQWYPRGGHGGWQPYVGAGVNYTTFFEEDLSGELTGVLADPEILGASRADLDLDDSFGLAAQAGVDIPLGERLALNVGIWYLDIDTTATISTDVGRVKFDVDIDPWVYNLGFAWRF